LFIARDQRRQPPDLRRVSPVASLPRRQFDVNDLPEFNHIAFHGIEIIE
jgi:hypothetical protein